MADWGVVGVCAAGGFLAGPVLDRLARTVRRPAKKPVTAPEGVGDPALAAQAVAVGQPVVASAESPALAMREALPTPAAPPQIPQPAGDGPSEVTPPPLTWASVGWGGITENLAAAVACAVLEGLAALRLGAVPALGGFGALMAALVCLSIIDLRTGLLPKRFVYPAWGLVAIGLVAASNVSTTWHELLRGLIGGAVAFAVFYAIWLVYPRGMGFGDVRLAGLLGMSLGWLGWRQEYIGFLAACVLGSLLGVAFLVAVRRSRPFPFGPALAAGTAFGVLWGGWLGDLWFHPH